MSIHILSQADIVSHFFLIFVEVCLKKTWSFIRMKTVVEFCSPLSSKIQRIPDTSLKLALMDSWLIFYRTSNRSQSTEYDELNSHLDLLSIVWGCACGWLLSRITYDLRSNLLLVLHICQTASVIAVGFSAYPQTITPWQQRGTPLDLCTCVYVHNNG